MFEEPAMPGFHQPLRLGSGFFMKMEHAARTAAAWATLAVAIEQFLLIQEINGLVQNGFRDAQLWMLPLKSLEQPRWVAVVLKKAGQDPAHRKFEIQEQWRWLLKIMFDIGQAVVSGVATLEHKADRSQIGLARSRFDFQAANEKTFGVRTRGQSGELRPNSLLP